MVVKTVNKTENKGLSMTRAFWLMASTGLLLAACDRSVPDDTQAGVGFGDYGSYQQTRVAAQQQLAGQPGGAVALPGPETVIPPATVGADPLASRAAAAIAEAEAGTGAQAVPLPANGAGISDEQSFDAVAARETIETDADRLARMAAERVEVEPTAVPARPGSTGPNIVEYALSATHPVGQSVYRRSAIGQGRHEDNCLSYQSADLAQQAFLSMGGPERDRQALDPDGDGFACSWNPDIYRAAARGG